MKITLALICLVPFSAICNAQDEQSTRNDELKSFAEKYSYILGKNLMEDFNSRQIEIDVDRLILGIRDAAARKKSRLSNEEIVAVMTQFQKQMMKKEQEMFSALADKNLRDGEKFLKDNALKEGIKQTESGLQYKVLKEGSGEKPVLTDLVKVHIRALFIDGREFEATDPRKPLQASVESVPVQGLKEAIRGCRLEASGEFLFQRSSLLALAVPQSSARMKR